MNRSHILKLVKVSAEIVETRVEEIKPKKEDKKADDKKDEKKEEDKKADDKKDDKADAKTESKEEPKSEDKKTEEKKEEDKKEEPKVEEPKKEFKTSKVPHTYSVIFKEKLNGVRLLDEDQIRAAKTRIRALEKRDEDKFRNEEAKNTFETLIYEFRGFLNEDENNAYSEEKDREAHIEKTRAEEEWLDDEGSDAGYKLY